MAGMPDTRPINHSVLEANSALSDTSLRRVTSCGGVSIPHDRLNRTRGLGITSYLTDVADVADEEPHVILQYEDLSEVRGIASLITAITSAYGKQGSLRCGDQPYGRLDSIHTVDPFWRI